MVISITRPLHCSPLKIQSAYSAPTWKSQTTNLQTETGSCSLGKLQIKYCRPGDHPPARGNVSTIGCTVSAGLWVTSANSGALQ